MKNHQRVRLQDSDFADQVSRGRAGKPFKKPRKKSTHPETPLQISVVEFLEIALPPCAVFFHVPNGELRDKRAAARLKKMGTKAGIPDLCIIWAGMAVFVELKAGKGPLTKSQEERIPELENAGVLVFICRSVLEVEEALENLMPLRATSKGGFIR